MAEANHVRACITFAFFTFINVEVSRSVSFKDNGPSGVGNCRWIERENYGIDLSPLENYTTGIRFITYADPNVLYFYHPCSDISLPTSNPSECKAGCSLCFFKAENSTDKNLDVNSVLKSEVKGQFYKLGQAGEGVFQSSGKEVHLVFNTKNTSTTINLVCNSENGANTTLSVKDAKNINITNHNLTLLSPYSCLKNFSHEKHHMTGWGVFFIILVTIAAAYFFGGMLVLKHVKGATGTEMIPNYEFWVSLPGRIKYFFMRLIGRGNEGPDSYERI